MTEREIEAMNLGTALSAAIGELAKAEALYQKLFPDGLAFCQIDFPQIRGFVIDARKAVKRELEAMDAAKEVS